MKRWVIGGAVAFGIWALASTIAARGLAQRDAHIGSPLLLEGAVVPENIVKIMDRACRDCHSNQTSWPWYAGLPPASTLIAGDVEKGRKFLNLSHWNQYTIPQRMGYLASMSTSTRQDRMPPPMYRWIHWPATLTDQDRSEIKDWAKLESKRLMSELRAARKPLP